MTCVQTLHVHTLSGGSCDGRKLQQWHILKYCFQLTRMALTLTVAQGKSDH